MRREGEEIWLGDAEWIPWCMKHHPERFRDPAAEARAELQAAFANEDTRAALLVRLTTESLTRLMDQLAAQASPYAPKLIAEVQAVLNKRERDEARQWRCGRAQGLLARTSPLRAELARKERQA